ncbi:sigma 54-interacting transcriptional regulator [Lignipirellula cremea]|uniref:Transcriptional regulatory protein ZraR n=1 Tax=Lignipirellula cremea TaxID=2528010 RepID=A0A518DLH7_9BACT|nr:sigma 54-interacting transcriptional regulator [Lignipirellula cremea]QDU92690.1 Transcriptional regulatory protein ZraR [Lignipirellula cremea]
MVENNAEKLAYLVIRDGAKWSDVFRLIPGRTVTVGRAPGNEIVLKDEQISRRHAEIFMTQGSWTVRDLDSRNGTAVGSERVVGDCPLFPGDVIRIAHSQLAFVEDLSNVFGDSTATVRSDEPGGDTLMTEAPDLSGSSISLDSSATITHRRHNTRFLEPARHDDEISIPRVGRAAKMLCRLAFELANQPDARSVANLALEGVFEGAKIDAGAVLLAPRELEGEIKADDLQVIATRTDSGAGYHRISNFIAETVLREGEAVLARNVAGDDTLGSRDSKGEISTTSVLCAPIRQDKKVIGFIHLYSTDTESAPDPDDLEFTLAVADNVALALKNLARQQDLAEHLTRSKYEINQLRERLGVESEIVGGSALMRQVHEDIAKAAPSRATVLIRGESGSGKELVARAVHFSSPRKNGPFVCLNCAALSESLLESELFGHEKGAFTGATDRKVGKFEAADKGTLMLDEIGEMSPSIQAKFLRVLEGHPFERVGGAKAIHVDVRVIAATNRDLEKAVQAKEFRRDLYFRLRVIEVFAPPLRKRPADVIELAHHFLARFNTETGRKITGYSPDALQHLRHYRWPGNVRELKNVIERAVVLARGETIEVHDLALSNLATASESGEIAPPALAVYEEVSLKEIEKRHIAATLQANSWNKSRAAAILGIERSTLDRKISRYKINREPSFREE